MKSLILTGPSGSGKTTLAHILLEKHMQLTFSISATTRPPRMGELNGYHYYFMTQEEFEIEINRGGFVEWERIFAGHYYGTLLREIERIQALQKIPLFVKDVKGALSLKKALGKEALTVFILPPSIEELERRLAARGVNNPAEVEERLKRAEEELSFLPQFDFIAYNEDITKASARLEWLIHRYLL
ncbi:MAG: guanylate kinase [Bacteroidia bacterium]|nr:guanylate kinase [Bacteroidia bacterium]MDW8133558.1 guanylate kinase [Bacteroidia bacterium]